MITIELNRVQKDFGFEAKDAYGHVVRMDTSPDSGGKNFGVRPMQMLLMGVAGCSAIDVISILNKQRQNVQDYKMIVRGVREADKEPSLWETVEIDFYMTGSIDADKAMRAADLSIRKYCSASATLEAAGAKISWNIFINNEPAGSGKTY